MTDEEINRLPKWVGYLGIVGLGMWLIWAVIYNLHQAKKINEGVRYTIGYVTKTGYVVGPSSHTAVSFEYEANGRRYATTGSGEPINGCTRCLVKFAVQDPEVLDFYNQICVPDEVQPPPPEGWSEPPFFVRAGALD
ncbi:MAG TPA: hypothetical protein VK364_09520 [Hymenobacter sp.]|nr:hypothetical protein [Hymenobacter sp.]